MFKEKLSDEKIYDMTKDYLSIVVGEDRAEEYLEESRKVKTPSVIRYDFTDENHKGQFVAITDFDAVVSCAIVPVQEFITMMHRKEMYKSFGKEYINALDMQARKPFEELYNRQLSKHNKMLEEITSEYPIIEENER